MASLPAPAGQAPALSPFLELRIRALPAGLSCSEAGTREDRGEPRKRSSARAAWGIQQTWLISALPRSAPTAHGPSVTPQTRATPTAHNFSNPTEKRQAISLRVQASSTCARACIYTHTRTADQDWMGAQHHFQGHMVR